MQPELFAATVGAFLTIMGGVVTHYLQRVTSSIEKLNENMAMMVERVHSHEKRIDSLEEQIK